MGRCSSIIFSKRHSWFSGIDIRQRHFHDDSFEDRTESEADFLAAEPEIADFIYSAAFIWLCECAGSDVSETSRTTGISSRNITAAIQNTSRVARPRQ